MIRSRFAHALILGGIAAAALVATVASAVAPPAPIPGTIETIAGGGAVDADGVPATSASFSLILGIAVNATGDVFVSDATHCSVRKISNGIITRVVGTGICPDNPDTNDVGDGGPALAATLLRPAGLAFDSGGNLYIADSFHCEIRKVDAQTDTISAFAGKGPFFCGGLPGDGGSATEATLLNPYHLAIDRYDNVYISELFACRVRKVSNGIISAVAGRANPCEFSGDGGPAIDALLSAPAGLAVDRDGVLYIADRCRIREVRAGVITTIAGTGTCYLSYLEPDGPATERMINEPQDIAVDDAGNLLIADTENCLVRQVKNGMMTTVAGALHFLVDPYFLVDTYYTVCGHTGDGGPATSAEIGQPAAVAVDSAGNVYFAELHMDDPGASTIRVAGTGLVPVDSDGDGLLDGVETDTGVFVDAHNTGTDPLIADTDADACGDGSELSFAGLNPTDPWDFYSVPIPALFAAPNPATVFKDNIVAASDAQAVFGYFERGAKTGTTEYEQDLNVNGISDGVEYDRSFVGPAATGPPDGIVSASDAQLAFAQFKLGYHC